MNSTKSSQHSRQPYDKVAADCDRDYWMTSQEAKEYGLVDEVLLTNPRKLKKIKTLNARHDTHRYDITDQEHQDG